MDTSEKGKAAQPPHVSDLIERAEPLVQELRHLVAGLAQFHESPDAQEKAGQLKEISRTVTRLESMKVPVPNELRNLKTDLVAELGIDEHVRETLTGLRDGLAEVLDAIQHRTGKPGTSDKPRRKRSQLPRTDKQILRGCLLKALKAKGGKASIHEVLDWMEEHLKDRLQPGDLETHPSGAVVWQRNTHWERFSLVQEGILKSHSPRGIWELDDDHR
jgi:hypothetical protein